MPRYLITMFLLAATVLASCGDDDVAADAAQHGTDDVGQTEGTESTGESAEAFCLGWNSFEPPPPDADIETAFTALLASAEALAEVAPDEIAEASRTWVEMERTIGDHIASYDWDPDAPYLPEETAARDRALHEVEGFAEREC